MRALPSFRNDFPSAELDSSCLTGFHSFAKRSVNRRLRNSSGLRRLVALPLYFKTADTAAARRIGRDVKLSS
jgi:hypothetical protein